MTLARLARALLCLGAASVVLAGCALPAPALDDPAPTATGPSVPPTRPAPTGPELTPSGAVPSSAAPTEPASASGAPSTGPATCLPTEKLCFTVPAGWQAVDSSSTPATDVYLDTITFDDATGRPVVRAQSANAGGLGGVCSPAEFKPYYVVAATRTAVKDSGGRPVYAIKLVAQFGGYWQASEYLTADPAYTSVGEGQGCGAFMSPFWPGVGAVTANVSVTTTISPDDDRFSDRAAAQAWLATDTARNAFDLLTSATYRR